MEADRRCGWAAVCGRGSGESGTIPSAVGVGVAPRGVEVGRDAQRKRTAGANLTGCLRWQCPKGDDVHVHKGVSRSQSVIRVAVSHPM